MTSKHSNGHAERARYRWTIPQAIGMSALVAGAFATGCDYVDTPHTYVVLDNAYAPTAETPLVVYRAFWEATKFCDPLPPGSSSTPQTTVPCSENTAWVVLAPGWKPDSGASPTSFVLMESKNGFGVDLNDTLHIPVDDSTFIGNCGAHSFLSQTEADRITQLVFPSLFTGLRYDAATCTTVPVEDARAR